MKKFLQNYINSVEYRSFGALPWKNNVILQEWHCTDIPSKLKLHNCRIAAGSHVMECSVRQYAIQIGQHAAPGKQ